ncbi:MAG TPA: baseplate J/gp47 family protein [Thermoanaerobaculia bacterium]|nr:baseplate J/gp47 family protein [Thermoanaerobaculia bacterium]
MSFIDRTFPDVVRDVLTNLTQGVVGETHRIESYDPKARPLVLPEVVLQRRPVRRVSFVRGFVAAPEPDDDPLPYTFGLADYQLVPLTEGGADLARLRFLPFGKRPAPGTDLLVNYYPRSTDATPITDLNVGSVARTLVEAVSRELALSWAQLNLVYDSAFVGTASGPSLERVVELLGVRRFEAGRAAGAVTFRRRPGLAGSITIPAGTPVADGADKVRYETVESHEMLAGESVAEVRVRGTSTSTPPVEAGVLTVIQRAIAGLESVSNERPTSRASEQETDEQLRERARSALLASDKGTPAAIRFGLLQLPEVRDARVIEMPNGVPGEIRVEVALDPPQPADSPLPPRVKARLDELRPAGIRVLGVGAGVTEAVASLVLTLAGPPRPPADVEPIRAAARDRLLAEVQKKGVGETLRVRPLSAALLADSRLVDVVLTLGRKGSPAAAEGADLVPDPGTSVSLAAEDVSFQPLLFDPPAALGPVQVEVRLKAALTLEAGVSAEAAKQTLTAKLKGFFAQLAPGTAIDSAALLAALRQEGQYGLDPLTLVVTLTAGDQFFQIAEGGGAFTVQPEQTFEVVAVEIGP